MAELVTAGVNDISVRHEAAMFPVAVVIPIESAGVPYSVNIDIRIVVIVSRLVVPLVHRITGTHGDDAT